MAWPGDKSDGVLPVGSDNRLHAASACRPAARCRERARNTAANRAGGLTDGTHTRIVQASVITGRHDAAVLRRDTGDASERPNRARHTGELQPPLYRRTDMAQLLSASHRSSRARVKPFKRAVFVGLAAGAVLFASSSLVAAATAPSLGAAGSYSVLAHTAVTNTGSTTMPGDLGVSAGSAVTGFPPGIVGPPGTIHLADSNAAAAQVANTAAFGVIDQVCTVTYAGNKDLVGLSLVPGVYCADTFTLTGTLTLSGSGVWIFKSAATLITSGTANVVGGDPCNVWWREVSSAILGTNTSLIGNVLASTSISLATGANLNGRALAQTGAVTLESNTITGAICLPLPPAAKTATAV